MSEVNWELVVHRLDTIVKSQDEFKQQLDDIDEKLVKLETIKHTIETLEDWKKKVDDVLGITDMKNIIEWKSKLDDVISPSQLKEHICRIDKKIEELESFKTKSTMIWITIQAIIFILYFLDKTFHIF